MPDTWVRLCGIPRPSDYLCRNWPKVCCTLELGHESDHEFARDDGVSFVWPVTLEDVERNAERLRHPSGT